MEKIQKKTIRMKTKECYSKYIFNSSNILVPNKNVDMKKWAVIACDQHTSDKFYWDNLKKEIGSSPSTINLICPEVYADSTYINILNNISKKMNEYVEKKYFTEYNSSIIYTIRELSNGLHRSGIVGQVDLEEYEGDIFKAKTIKPTEKTDTKRMDIRRQIKERSLLDVSHIILFYQDEKNIIGEKVKTNLQDLPLIYDFKTLDSKQRISGYLINGKLKKEILKELNQKFISKQTPLIVADGNHSLLSAKLIYEDYKRCHKDYLSSPLRYALVEIENLYDKEIEIEPIHRYVYNIDGKKFFYELDSYIRHFGGVALQDNNCVKMIVGNECHIFKIPKIDSLTPIETIQNFIDDYLIKNGGNLDYVHELDKVIDLVNRNNNSVGILFEKINKNMIADRISHNQIFERKSFSIGKSEDKRYYLETRYL